MALRMKFQLGKYVVYDDCWPYQKRREESLLITRSRDSVVGHYWIVSYQESPAYARRALFSSDRPNDNQGIWEDIRDLPLVGRVRLSKKRGDEEMQKEI